eukprot:Opistho-2@15763
MDMAFGWPREDILATVDNMGALFVWRIEPVTDSDTLRFSVIFRVDTNGHSGPHRLLWSFGGGDVIATRGTTVEYWRMSHAIPTSADAVVPIECASAATSPLATTYARHTLAVHDVCLSPDNDVIVSGGADGLVCFFDATLARSHGTHTHGPVVNSVLRSFTARDDGAPVFAVALLSGGADMVETFLDVTSPNSKPRMLPSLLAVGFLHNSEIRLFSCTHNFACLQTVSFSSPPSSINTPSNQLPWNHVSTEPSSRFLVLSSVNRRSSVIALMVGATNRPNSAENSLGFVGAVEFGVAQPLLSFVVPSTVINDDAEGGAVALGAGELWDQRITMQAYCMQEKAIQQLTLSFKPVPAAVVGSGEWNSISGAGASDIDVSANADIAAHTSLETAAAMLEGLPLPPSSSQSSSTATTPLIPSPTPIEAAFAPALSASVSAPLPTAHVAQASATPAEEPAREKSRETAASQKGQSAAHAPNTQRQQPSQPTRQPKGPTSGGAKGFGGAVHATPQQQTQTHIAATDSTSGHVDLASLEQRMNDRLEALARENAAHVARLEELQLRIFNKLEADLTSGSAHSLDTSQTLTAAADRIVAKVTESIGALKKDLPRAVQANNTAIDKAVKEAVASSLATPAGAAAIGAAVASSLQPVIADAFRRSVAESLVPAFERACQTMFTQVNATFERGMREFSDRAGPKGNAVTVTQLQELLASHSAQTQASIAQAVEKLEGNLSKSIVSAVQAEVSKSGKPAREGSEKGEKKRPDSKVQMWAEIQQNIKDKDYAPAFSKALGAMDLAIVVKLCQAVSAHEPNAIFGRKPPVLTQPIFLSLIQQLSVDFTKDTDLKLLFLQNALMEINTDDHVIKKHAPTVLAQLSSKLDQLITNVGDGSENSNLIQTARMIKFVVDSICRRIE